MLGLLENAHPPSSRDTPGGTSAADFLPDALRRIDVRLRERHQRQIPG
jgi:hypothetical protein